jgi:hypothetical protein
METICVLDTGTGVYRDALRAAKLQGLQRVHLETDCSAFGDWLPGVATVVGEEGYATPAVYVQKSMILGLPFNSSYFLVIVEFVIRLLTF